jgi:hypothetical protein
LVLVEQAGIIPPKGATEITQYLAPLHLMAVVAVLRDKMHQTTLEILVVLEAVQYPSELLVLETRHLPHQVKEIMAVFLLEV